MGVFKSLIRSTTLYENYKVAKTAKRNKKWDAEDDSRLEFYTQFVQQGTTCFDVGANIGNRTKIFLKLVGSRGKVVAVEPQAFCCNVLQKSFVGQPNFVLEKKALGAAPGEAEILISNETTVSSMSEKWVEQAKKNKRFGEETEWQTSAKVKVITLDSLIEKYGEPSFIKIDVEGYEKEVISGLTRPIRSCFSLEFVPEFLASTFECLKHLSSFGKIECNYSLGETMALSLTAWVPLEETMEILASYENEKDVSVFGDVYVRLVP